MRFRKIESNSLLSGYHAKELAYYYLWQLSMLEIHK